MKKTFLIVMSFAAAVLNAAAGFPAQSPEQAVIKRFLVSVGANSGGKERAPLRYAVNDAEAILQVFNELGGVDSEDTLYLKDPDVRTFFTEMGKLQAAIHKSREKYSRVEFIFYYSGHSDDQHILLGEEKISYKDLRETIENAASDVRIAILDSCASGAFTRIKGGRKRLPFLLDSAYDMRGYAALTSSSSSEASQESDLIKGSFFTHYLISGMRGGADMSQDGRVTLNEAYQFAFNETLAETTKTVSGPQHPHNHIQMTGTGDVVMSDIRKASAVLRLGEALFGRLFIHDKNDRLVVELTKTAGRKIELGLEEGSYRVINIPRDAVFESRIELKSGLDFELTPDHFTELDREYTTPRGDRELRVRRQAVLPEKSKTTFFADLMSRSTSIYGKYGLLMGGNFGVTFNSVLSVGAGGYGKVNNDPGLPSYGGVSFAYVFKPNEKLHFRATALAGAGNSPSAGIFYILEPGVEVVLNLSQTVRFQFGLSLPLVDKANSGLESPMFTLGFQFGK